MEFLKLGEIWGFSGFFSDFKSESSLLSQKWGLVCQYAGIGRYGQDKCVEKRRKIGKNWHKFQ